MLSSSVIATNTSEKKMAHFAKVENGIVTQVIVAEQEFIDSGAVGNPSDWVQTSYNTYGGIHYGQDGNPDGGVALRKNYAGVGFTYDPARDAFIEPQIAPSWTLDEASCRWVPPVPYPNDTENAYTWDEPTLSWVIFNE